MQKAGNLIELRYFLKLLVVGKIRLSNEFRDKEWRVDILAGSHRSMEVTSGVPASVLILVQVINDPEKGLST